MRKLILNIILLFGICNILIAQNGLSFDGSDDIVQTNYGGILDSANRTFEAWVFVDSDAPESNLAIIDYGLNAVGARNTFSVSGSRQLIYISGGTNTNISSPDNSVAVDEWVHVAFVLDSGTGYLYVNGVQVGTGNLTNVNTPSNGQDLRIGQRVNGGSIPFHGVIDEVRIWSSARTQAEIEMNMNNEMCSTDSDLQLYLRLNEGDADSNNAGITNAIDDSGNSYVASLNSFMLSGATSNWVTGADIIPGLSFASAALSECSSYTWSANSMTYNSSGIYSAVTSNVNGCDSLITLDLTINQAPDLTTNISNCDSFFWELNGQTYTSSTTVVEPQISDEGCPYNHTLNLNLSQSYFDTTNFIACNQYIWPVNGQLYSTTGLFTEMYTTANGCDSIITLNLGININSIDTELSYDENLTVTSNQVNASYQWLDCDNNFTTINGATSQTYLAPASGNFAVEIIVNACKDTSACIAVDGFNSIESLNTFGAIRAFPNPTKSNTMLSFEKQVSNVDIIITDILGRLVSSFTLENVNEASIDIEGAPGIYLIQLRDDTNHSVVFKVLKE